MLLCFQRNLTIFAKARPAQMVFITTSVSHNDYISQEDGYLACKVLPEYM